MPVIAGPVVVPDRAFYPEIKLLKTDQEADFYLYAEYVQIDYFSRVDAESYEFTADDDFRAGVEIFLPFGSTKDRLDRH